MFKGYLCRLLAPPVFLEDREKTRKARWLNLALLTEVLLLLLVAAGNALSRQRLVGVSALALLCIPILLSLRAWMFHGRVLAATYSKMLTFSILTTLALVLLGTAFSPIVAVYVLIIATTGLLLDRRAVIRMTVLNVILFSAVCAAGQFGLLSGGRGSLGGRDSLPEYFIAAVTLVYAGVFTIWIQETITEAVALAEEGLRGRSEFVSRVINALEDPVFVKDAEHRWTILNDAACVIIGGSREWLLGQRDADLLEDFARVLSYEAEDHRVLDSGVTSVREEELRISGEQRTISTKKSRFIDPLTGERYIAATIRDITDLKRLERDLQRSRAELELQVASRTAELRAVNESLVNQIVERHQVEAALRDSEERYVLAARGANDGLWDMDLTTGLIYLSPRFKSMLGLADSALAEARPPATTFPPRSPLPAPESLLVDWFSHIHPEDRETLGLRLDAHLQGREPYFECEFRALHADGSYRWMLTRGIAVRDANGAPSRIAGSMTDITERKRVEAQLLHDAFHDGLTGLPNRALLVDRLEQAIHAARRSASAHFAVLYMDLDRFKDINDSLGHSIGDRLLIAAAQRVQACLRVTDTLARFGGDEFVILLNEVTSDSQAVQIAERIQAQMRQPFELNGLQAVTSASIGIVLCDPCRERAEEILRDADIAMYRAKALGRARHQVFDGSMHDQILARMRLETDLRRALERGEIEVFYQPIMALNPGAPGSPAAYDRLGGFSGFEALARWRRPGGELVLPRDFIAIAEESLLIIPLDRRVLEMACAQMRLWQERTGLPLKLSVNLSGKQFVQPDLIEHLRAVLAQTGFPPADLRLEITEGTIMENIALASQTLMQMQDLGVQVEIDDFGTGFSSMTYLFELPVNTLKIDRSFIRSMLADHRKAAVVETIVTLAHNIGLDVVAEGVETPEQVAALRAIACDYGQGFLYANPLPIPAAEAYIRACQAGLPEAIKLPPLQLSLEQPLPKPGD